MRCQNITDNNRRCKRTASKLAIVKQTMDEKLFKLRIFDDCFNGKMYNDKIFKDHVIQVTELNKNRHEFFYY